MRSRIDSFALTRFQFARDRAIGDSQIRVDDCSVAALELLDGDGHRGLGFMQNAHRPLPALDEVTRIFRDEVWPGLDGQPPQALIHRVSRPRGGNRIAYNLPFGEAVQIALWDLAAQQAGLPLHVLLGSRRARVRAYASGLDFHLGDDDYAALFAHARSLGYTAFKIKVGHPDFARDLHRVELLKRTVGDDAVVMIDANEAWGAKEALVKLTRFRDAGHAFAWVEDPIMRDDFEGLRMLRQAAPWTLINSGEYLDVVGKQRLLLAGGTDILNVHGPVTDVMRIGWLAGELGIPVSLGNTFLEVGVHAACALPEVEWLEYSFQNFDHLVEQPIEIRDGWAYAPDRPGHGLVLSQAARETWARPDVLPAGALGAAPENPRLRL